MGVCNSTNENKIKTQYNQKRGINKSKASNSKRKEEVVHKKMNDKIGIDDEKEKENSPKENKLKDKDYKTLKSENKNSDKTLTQNKIITTELIDDITNSTEENKNSKLDIAENCIAKYMEIQYIGSLILDEEDFGVIVFNKNKQNVISYLYQNYNNNKDLHKFGSFSSFCNCNNKIYLSGGEYQSKENKENLKTFIQIDLTLLSKDNLPITELPDLIHPRAFHSMIYIPNKYIFIVGGIQNKTVEIYDFENKTIKTDSELCEPRCESTLCFINNTYLYAFCGFSFLEAELKSIERCKLKNNKRNWEIVNYKTPEGVSIRNNFFGVGYYKNKGVILIGGKENQGEESKSYIYTVGSENDLIQYFDNIKMDFEPCVFKEKFFIPVNNNFSMVFPFTFPGISTLFLDNEKGEIIKTDFMEIKNDNDISSCF